MKDDLDLFLHGVGVLSGFIRLLKASALALMLILLVVIFVFCPMKYCHVS